MKAKQKPAVKRSAKTVKSSTKNKNTPKKIVFNTDFLRRKRWLLFASFFALVGASYLYFSKADSTFGDVPTDKNQIVVQYSLGMAHQLKENDLSATMPIPMLLYANGTMICGDTSQGSMPNMPDMPVNYHAKQLSKPETKAVFQKLLDLGVQQAADFTRPANFTGAADAADMIVLNSTKGAYYATQYPGETNTAFQAVQHYLQQQCQQVTQTYAPDQVNVETAPADDTVQATGDLSDVSADLQDNTTTDAVGTKKMGTAQSGQVAQNLKKKIPLGTTGIYTVNGKKTKVRLTPQMPTYDYPQPFSKDGKNTAHAANIRSVRWLFVVPSDMATSSTYSSYISGLADSIRSFYARNTGRTITISQISVVRGNKTSAQYKQCPSAGACSYGGTFYPSLAVYNNMANEFAKTDISTNVVYPFNTTDQCTGWGGPVGSTNDATFSFGFSAFSSAGCYWSDGEHEISAHETGHTFGLIHTCNHTIMDGLGSGCNLTPPSWSNITLDSGQASFLRSKSPYFNAPLPPKITLGDIDGNGKSDILAIQANGTCWIYHNTGNVSAPFGARTQIGTTSSTWTSYNRIMLADVNGDGRADLLATKADGTFWEYQNTGNAAAPFGAARQIGSGWNIFTKLVAADMDGTHRANMLGVDSSGQLWEYTNTGVDTSPYSSSSTAYKRVIGTGWDTFSFLAAGDVTGDGRADVLGVTSTGVLIYYKNTGNNTSPVSSATGYKTQLGSGWSAYNTFHMGDLNGDGKAEIMTTKSDGTLWQYLNNGSTDPLHMFNNAQQIGSSWNTYSP